MISKLFSWLSGTARKVCNWVEAKLNEGKKKASSKSDWLKLIGFAFAGVAICLVAVAIVIFGVLFVIALPGLILGLPAWLCWTYLGMGAHFFPTLDPVWLQITYGQFAFILAVLVWAVKLVRGKRRESLAETLGSYPPKK